MVSGENGKLLVLISAFLLISWMLTFSCGEDHVVSDKIRVVVSQLPLADFVKQVGKDKVQVTVMIPPGATPHFYEPKPEQLKMVSQARVFVKMGSKVEFELSWMDKLTQINKDMLVINSSQGIKIVGEDPHIWLSPTNAKRMVENICAGLKRVDPQNGEFYQKNMNEYLEKLDKLDRYIKEKLKGIKNRSFMVCHPAWGYFARAYNLEQIPIQHQGKEPTAQEIKEAVKKAEEFNHHVIFVSPQFATKGAEAIARQMGGKIVSLDPLPQDYISDMRSVADKLVQAMR